ncbi:MAG: hypothetical protein LBF37_01270 [Rickettsiales bacterium]|jgi:FMN phosphatase YigB (HAD superfamily)|nr:hypothetical protein [Rickettsiales bacterium]
MRIALDCDETLLFAGQSLSDYYRSVTDKDVNMPADIWSSQWSVWNGDKIRWKEWFNTWINSEWYSELPTFPGALAAVAQLKADGHQLFVVSAGLSTATARRRANLEKVFGPVFDDVIVVNSSDEKKAVLADLDIDVFIDDDIKNLISAAPIPGIAIRQSANMHQIGTINPLPDNVQVADNWQDIIRILHNIK